MRRKHVDRGSCGECRRFGNDLKVLGDTWLMDAFTDLEGDETVPRFTAWCARAVGYYDPRSRDPRAGFVAEDEPACPWKVEPPYLPPRIRTRREA